MYLDTRDPRQQAKGYARPRGHFKQRRSPRRWGTPGSGPYVLSFGQGTRQRELRFRSLVEANWYRDKRLPLGSNSRLVFQNQK